ncbi:DUF4265 domain-containing protein [Corynebacterium cystitidis]|uniref:DUF4265 domain-containing protein n=1 Tax=Corynebacterium cystitidis TaxID=35757 RepID=UPI00211E343E|nr:DUF4265 domain-containing protein [Corynebacterium cystitidis]
MSPESQSPESVKEELEAHDLGGGHFIVASAPFVGTTMAVGDMLVASIGADCPYGGIAEWLKSLVDDGVIQVAPGYTAGTA